MTSFTDLLNYKRGISKHRSGSEGSGHAVVIVGWGMSGNSPSWIVMNSWGWSWGMNGYFYSDMNDADTGLGEAAYSCIPEI